MAQRNAFPAFAGSPLTFMLRLALTLGLALGLAWLLERRLHPWLRSRFATAADSNFPRETNPRPNPPA
jgi:peptidoglycan/LPS O-acetylase OafA/YrhL